jgi:hypothetical protein
MVCSHTYDHKQLTSLEEWQIRDEIVRGMEAVERVVGYRCPYFRVPYGSVNARIAAVTDSLDLQLVGWDASLSDSAPTGTDPDKQVRLALRSIRPGSILLGHFGATNSYVVLRRVIDSLLESGYRIGSLSELIRGDVPPPQLTVLAETTPSSRGASAARSSAAGVVRRVDWKGMLAASGQIAAGLALILLAAFGVWRGHVRRRRFARRVQLELEFQPVMTTVTSPIFTEDDPALSLASTPVDENVVESTPWSS